MAVSSSVLSYVMVCLMLSLNSFVLPFATHLTRDHCDREMKSGVVIMGKETLYSTEKKLLIYRDSELLQNGEYFVAGDELTVKIEPKSFQIVLEISGGFKFADNSPCDGTRSNKNGAIINIPHGDHGPNNITVIGVWAKSYSGGVKITEAISLFRTSEKDLQYKTPLEREIDEL